MRASRVNHIQEFRRGPPILSELFIAVFPSGWWAREHLLSVPVVGFGSKAVFPHRAPVKASQVRGFRGNVRYGDGQFGFGLRVQLILGKPVWGVGGVYEE